MKAISFRLLARLTQKIKPVQFSHVYRLEKDGVGPLRHPKEGAMVWGSSIEKLWDKHKMNHRFDRLEDHNWFWDLVQKGKYLHGDSTIRFACTTLEALYEYWSPEFVEECLKEGFEIKSYRVKGEIHICRKSSQLLYHTHQVA